MPINATWTDDSQTVIFAHFEGSWTVTEFSQVLQDIKTMTEDVSHPVYAIAVGENSRMPRTGNLLPHFRRLFQLPLVHIYAVPSTAVATAVLSMLTQLNADWHARITFVETVEDAREQVAAMKAVNLDSGAMGA